MPATIVADVMKDMNIHSGEIFGPVTTSIRADGEDHVIHIANDTEYGLSRAVFTGDVQRGVAVAKRIETGIAHMNGPTVWDGAQMPFGGVKASGYGRFGETAALDEFTELRWIIIEDPKRHYPI